MFLKSIHKILRDNKTVLLCFLHAIPFEIFYVKADSDAKCFTIGNMVCLGYSAMKKN